MGKEVAEGIERSSDQQQMSPKQDKIAFVLYKYGDCTYDEIAKLLNVTIMTARRGAERGGEKEGDAESIASQRKVPAYKLIRIARNTLVDVMLGDRHNSTALKGADYVLSRLDPTFGGKKALTCAGKPIDDSTIDEDDDEIPEHEDAGSIFGNGQ